MGPTPAAQKTERLLNLVICLLYTRRPLRKGQIRRAVPQYDQISDEAFDRMFERDKDELRELGIPLVTSQIDTFFDDEPGYRIDKREYDLPEIAFEPDEVAALALAARTWAQASLADSARGALRKLAAAGVERDGDSVLAVEPSVRTTEPAFDAVRGAVVQTYPIRFTYRRVGGEPSRRHLQPWGLAAWHGRWYVTGFDTDRGEPRVFRLSRIEGQVRRDGAPGSYEVPPDHDPLAMIGREVGPRPRLAATVAVRDGAGHVLRRRADAAAPDPDRPGWSRLSLSFTDAERLVDELCWYGPDVVVLEPPQVRAGVVERLGAVAGPAA